MKVATQSVRLYFSLVDRHRLSMSPTTEDDETNQAWADFWMEMVCTTEVAGQIFNHLARLLQAGATEETILRTNFDCKVTFWKKIPQA